MINIYFNNKDDSVIKKDGKPIAIKNFGKGSRAECLANFPKIVQIQHSNFMMEMKDSLFVVTPIQTATEDPTTAIFAMTFKALHEPDLANRFLFSNESLTRGISVQDKTWEKGVGVLTIYSSGGVQKQINFDRNEWAAIFIQYICIGKVVKCRYIFDRKVGELDEGYCKEIEDNRLFLGGHPTKKKAYHAVGSFEMYYKILKNGESGLLPEEMGKHLLQNIMDRVEKT